MTSTYHEYPSFSPCSVGLYTQKMKMQCTSFTEMWNQACILRRWKELLFESNRYVMQNNRVWAGGGKADVNLIGCCRWEPDGWIGEVWPSYHDVGRRPTSWYEGQTPECASVVKGICTLWSIQHLWQLLLNGFIFQQHGAVVHRGTHHTGLAEVELQRNHHLSPHFSRSQSTALSVTFGDKKFENMFIRFDGVHKRDERTDRRHAGVYHTLQAAAKAKQ